MCYRLSMGLVDNPERCEDHARRQLPLNNEHRRHLNRIPGILFVKEETARLSRIDSVIWWLSGI